MNNTVKIKLQKSIQKKNTMRIKRMYKSLFHFRYYVSLLYNRIIKKSVDL